MSSYFPVFFLFIVLFLLLREERINQQTRRIIKRKKRKGVIRVNDIISKYIGKDCLVYVTGSSALEGEIIAVEENWLVIKTKDGEETVNLDYIVRVKEHPRKSNGKKKSVVF